MADVHVMCALAAKRGELLGRIEERHRELKQLDGELAHLEATMRLFDPSCELDGVTVRRRARRRQFFRSGECQRLVLETLREAEMAISEQEVVARLLRAKGLEEQAEAASGVRKTALAVLRHLARKGVARPVALPGGERAWMRS